MKTILKIIKYVVIFIFGVGVGFGGHWLETEDQEFKMGKHQWFICTGIHESGLYDCAERFHKEHGEWPQDVSELVEKGYLPECSEIHYCPSQYDVQDKTMRSYDNYEFVTNQTGLVANYKASPYRFTMVNGAFRVMCIADAKHNPELKIK